MPKRYEISEKIGPQGTPDLAQFEGYTVAQWCPTPDGSGPPTAVVLQLDVANVHFVVNGRRAAAVGLRLKSRHAINVLLEILERHRDAVFPQ